MTNEQNGPPGGGGDPHHRAAHHTNQTSPRQKADKAKCSALQGLWPQEAHADLGLVDNGCTVGGDAL